MNITRSLILGGVKSGKSRYAMQLATDYTAKMQPVDSVIVIATARAGDDEMADRIEQHRRDRPSHWRVIEEPRYLSESLQRLNVELRARKIPPVVLIDCITLWLTQLCCEQASPDEVRNECQSLVLQVSEADYPIILVANESNMGVTPLGEFSRHYCDAAGLLHQSLAAVCSSVTLVVAGLPLVLKSG